MGVLLVEDEEDLGRAVNHQKNQKVLVNGF
jgi:hypothetical protein